MHVLTNAEKLIPLRDAASLAESRRLAGMRMVTGTTSPSTRYERISVSPASCSIKSEYVIASHAFKPQYKCINYTPAWEQRKLSELLLERDEQAPQSDQYPLMAFIANQGIAPKGDRYDRSALVNDIEGKLYKRTEKGDFIYSSNNLETGSIGLNKYGNACISPVYSIFQPSGIADSDFLGRRLVRKDFIQEMVKWRQGVIYGQWRIHEADFLRLNIAVPSVDEQRLIGKLLDNLDSLITLHQRKRQWLKWLDEGGEGTHHDIDILVFKFADDMKISVLCGVHACMTKSLGHTGNRYAGKQQQRGMGVP